MHIFEAIQTRRSVKNFDPEHKMPEDSLRTLKDLMRQSPTSFNTQNWRAVIIDDVDVKNKIFEAAWNQKQVADSSVLFVMCADIKAWQKTPERYWEDAPDYVKDALVPMIEPFYEGREWQQRDEAIRSIGIASQTLMLSAKAIGYDTCPMIGFDADKVAEIINLPENHIVGMMVAVGKAIQDPISKPGYIDDSEVFFTNSF